MNLLRSQGGTHPSPIMTRGLPYKASKKEEDIIKNFDLAPYLEHPSTDSEVIRCQNLKIES